MLERLIAILFAAGAHTAAGAAVPVSAGAAYDGPEIGISEQLNPMFFDSRFVALNVRPVRLMVPWDLRLRRAFHRATDGWVAKAAKDGKDILVVFARDDARPGGPPPATYAREIAWFMHRYPQVRSYAPWNEANLCTQSICDAPERAAAYYRAVRAACGSCPVLGAELVAGLPPSRAVPPAAYARALRRDGHVAPRLWGLHSYTDANRFQTRWTAQALRGLPGEVWLDETGGMVHRPGHRRPVDTAYRYDAGPERAAKVTRFVLERLARLSPRIRRLYIYQWNATTPRGWDSGLIAPDGSPRPAYRVLADAVGRTAHADGARAWSPFRDWGRWSPARDARRNIQWRQATELRQPAT